jgi:tRNA-specific 2-thiouridylase
MSKKALLLFSGGLDSILAAKILEKQKIKVAPVCFESFFFDCKLALIAAKKLGLKLKIVDISKEHLRIIKNPKYGKGKGANPCVDCHLLMIKKGKEIMKKKKFDFLATGEVLGERPFSQNKKIFELAEKDANLKGLILRPLSAKLLPKTLPEKKGWLKRENLFDFKGKSRKPQLKLAEQFKIKDFPSPAGGCILTDLDYSQKVKKLFKRHPDCDGNDCQLLRKGRIFWLPPTHQPDNSLVVVGRNEEENGELRKLKKQKDLILEPKNFPGPIVLIRGFGKKIKKEIIKGAIEILLHYTKKIPEEIIIKLKK